MLMTTALLLLCSCGDDDTTEDLLPQEEERHLISVSATTQDFTRSGEATMENIERAGFQVMAMKDGEVYFVDNCTYNPQNKEWGFVNGPHYWPGKEDRYDTNSDTYIKVSPGLDFYAFYCPVDIYNKNEWEKGWKDIELYSYQSFIDSNSDLLLAKLEDYAYESNPLAPGVLNFDFEHMMANVSISASVTSNYDEEYDYYTIVTNLHGLDYMTYYIDDDYWAPFSQAGNFYTMQFLNDEIHYTLNATAQSLGINRFMIPNNDSPDEHYLLEVYCFGHMNNENEGDETLLKNLQTTVNLNGCAGKNVVLNLNVDLHNDEIAIDTKHFHTSLDAPATRPSCE